MVNTVNTKALSSKTVEGATILRIGRIKRMKLTTRLVQSTADQYLSKSKKVVMENVTLVIEVKSNFCEKNFFHLLQMFHHY